MKSSKSQTRNAPCFDASIFSPMAAVELGEMREGCISKRGRGEDLKSPTNSGPTKQLILDSGCDCAWG
jgi:hypothetical protein